MIEKADVLVIGGGIFGTAIAFNLASNTRRSVVLVEKNEVGCGSTRMSAAIVRHNYSTDLMIESALESRKVYENFAERVGEPLEYIRNGEFVIDCGEPAKSSAQRVSDMRRFGLKAELLSPEQIRSRFPYIKVSDDEVGTLDIEAGFVVNPEEATAIYARQAAKHGARIYPGVRATSIKTEGGAVKSVVTSRGEIGASYVVNAAGPWAAPIGDMVGLKLPVKAERQQLVDIKPKHGWSTEHPTISDRKNIVYVKPTIDGLAHIGGHYYGKDCDPDDYNQGADPEFISDVLAKAGDRFPELKGAEVVSGYSGIYENTPDTYPLVGESNEVGGFVICAGWSGHGFKHGPAFGRLVAELIETGSTTLDLSILKPERFMVGKGVETPYAGIRAPYG